MKKFKRGDKVILHGKEYTYMRKVPDMDDTSLVRGNRGIPMYVDTSSLVRNASYLNSSFVYLLDKEY